MKKLLIVLMAIVFCLSIAAVLYSKGAVVDLNGNVGEPGVFYGVGEYCAKLLSQDPFATHEDFVDCVATVSLDYTAELCNDNSNPIYFPAGDIPNPDNLPYWMLFEYKNSGECVSAWRKVFNQLKKEINKS